MPDMKFIDDDCILMDKMRSENNKQLITEEQFQTAFLINVSIDYIRKHELVII